MSNQDQVFKQHPSLKSYHKTSDGTPFYKKENAQAHARGLKDKKVTEVVNPDPKSAPSAPVQKPASKKDKGSNKPESTPSKNQNTLDKLEDLTPMQKAKLRKNAIAKLESVEAVKEALKDETAPSVLKAGEERIIALESKAKGDKASTDEEE